MFNWMTQEEFLRANTPDSVAAQENPSNFWQPGALRAEFDPEWLRSIGFTGNAVTPGTFSDSGQTPDSMSPELQQFLSDKGLTQKMTALPGMNQYGYQYFDKNNNPVGNFKQHTLDPDTEFGIVANILMGIATAGASAAGMGSMGGTIGQSMGFTGPMANAVGNAALNTAMGSVVGNKPGVGTVANIAKAYMGQSGNSFMPDGYTMEPGFFDQGNSGASMFDWGDFGDQVGDYDMPTNDMSSGWWNNIGTDTFTGMDGTLGDQAGDYDMPTNDQTAGWWNDVSSQTGSGVNWQSLLGNKNLINLLGGLGSAALQQYGVNKSNQAIQGGLNNSNALLRYMYDQMRSDNMPALQARNAGLQGYQNLLANPSKITEDPGYKFGLSEAMKELDRRQSASGGYYSGATIRRATDRAQDYAGTKFDNALNRQGNLAGLGQVGTSQIGQAGMNYGNQAGQNNMLAGAARGASTMAGANNWADMLNRMISYGNQNIWGG